jgi:hypothetical protein
MTAVLGSRQIKRPMSSRQFRNQDQQSSSSTTMNLQWTEGLRSSSSSSTTMAFKRARQRSAKGEGAPTELSVLSLNGGGEDGKMSLNHSRSQTFFIKPGRFRQSAIQFVRKTQSLMRMKATKVYGRFE